MRLDRAWTGAAGLCVLLMTSACDAERRSLWLPNAPTSSPAAELPAPPTRTVTGSLWLHSPTGRQPLADIIVGFWVEGPRSAGSAGHRQSSSDGRFSFEVPSDARVRLYARTPELFQPCLSTAEVGQTETIIRMVADPHLQQARDWPEFAVERMLSGTVFEASATGRQPGADAWVDVVSDMGEGRPLADTRTDANGRFVLCGLERDTHIPHAVVVAKPGFHVAYVSIPAHGGGPLDVELRECGNDRPRLGGGWCH
jgi:hypothetical protein